MHSFFWDVLPLYATQTIRDTAIKSIQNSEPVGKTIMLILLGFSIASWTVMIGKWIALRRAQKESQRFLEACKQSARLSQGFSVAKKFKRSPLVKVYKAAYVEVQDLERAASLASPGDATPSGPDAFQIDVLERAIDRAIAEESSKLERHIPFLATCTTICPFLGLFGTVWGILDAFQAMASSRTVDVATLTPGISAALATTVAGLLVAIPAVLGYNGLLNRVQNLVGEMELLGSDIVSYVEKRLVPRA